MNICGSKRRRISFILTLLPVLTLVGFTFAHAEKGIPNLVPFQLTPERRQLIGVTVATVEEKAVASRIETTGTVESDEQLQAYVQTRFSGWIDKVFANQSFQHVKKGDPLFTIYSPDLVSTEQEYLLARRTSRRLANSSVDDVASGAETLVSAAENRLRLWGISPRDISRLAKTGKVRHALEVDSPISGYIVEQNARPNMYAQPETRLFTITSLSKVWVYAAVFQDQLSRIKVGDDVTVTVDSYPSESFKGKIDYVWPQIDPMTRTAKVRCELENPGIRLMPGMFTRIAIESDLGQRLAIPASAVLQTGTRNIAFIDRSDGYIVPKEIEIGPRAGDNIVVLSGLNAGDRVISSANFLIDSESQLQAAIGSFAPPPPGAGAAGASGPAATIEMTSDPSPPHKGSNTIRLLIRDPFGKPVEGAQVKVVFYMAAMPAMGMAAMRSEALADDKGAGRYEAAIKLGSGGTWQVTIVATKGGEQVATKQLNITAQGPMG